MGAMAGLALGDALGMPTQSMSDKQIRRYYDGPITKLMNAVPQQPIAPNMKAGAVTDDTEQAFVLARPRDRLTCWGLPPKQRCKNLPKA